ncbi:MAG: exodeoxyribonuclease VII large subunit [Candidatus Coprovivens sp.]
MNEEQRYFTVTQYNQAIKNFLDSKVECQYVHIQGEISNFKGHSRGHLYFTLKDEESRINAVMFQTSAQKLEFEPKDGDEVQVDGRISVYVPNGGYQVYIEKMRLAGNGDLLRKFEELKKKLEDEGLFDESHKKTIPRFPKKIGIITAPTGAAIRDILSTIKRRYPLCETILFPSLVQGDEAKFDIVRNLERAQDYDLDVIICGRGGGSIEDLWAFNEEIVARAIYESRIPIISGVGHEPDRTIADYVADLRAPTPTGAAEMAVPNLIDLLHLLEQYKIRMNENVKGIVNFYQKKLDIIKNSYVLKNPLALYEVKEQKLDTLIDRGSNIIKALLNDYQVRLDNIKSSYVLKNPLATYEVKKEKISGCISVLNKIIKSNLDNYNYKYSMYLNKLELLNPLNILNKGYSLVTLEGNVVKSSKDIKVNDCINVRLHEGNLEAIVKEIK